ncbi:MAG: hypothetical protein ABSA48_04135 [Terracidiphilus sp.]|jgi:hypothetical protein
MAPTAEFETELKVFEQYRKEWSDTHPGEYVVIQDGVVLEEFFNEYADAFKAGLRRFGVRRPFLIKQVWITEPVYFVA